MKMLKKSLALILSLIMALACFAVVASADEAEATLYLRSVKKGEGTFAAMIAQATANATVQLNKSVAVAETYTISQNVTVTSAGGAVITRADGFDAAIFNVSGGKLTLSNVTIDGKKAAKTTSPVLVTSGTFTVAEGAVIKDSTISGNGGAVSLGTEALGGADATLVMVGGSITGSSAAKGGAVAMYANSSAVVNGGSITLNTASADGGAVAILGSGAALSMKGGTISGNKAAGKGSAIYLAANSSATVTGGKIVDNTSSASLGAIYAENASSPTVGSGAYIYDNNGNNIYLAGDVQTTSLYVSPALTSGAKIGVKTQREYAVGASATSYIRSSTEVTGFIYNDATGDSFYMDSDGRISTPNTVTVYFDGGIGNVSTKSKIYIVGEAYGWLPTPDAVADASFVAWKYNGNNISSGSKVPDDESITLVADWKTTSKSLGILGTFFERIGKLIQAVAHFLQNLFAGTGDNDIRLSR